MFKSVGGGTPLSKKVELQIEQAIRDRRLVPGERLPSEAKLSASFGVSRTVMREAIRMLAARGLVAAEKGRGVFISDFTSAQVTDPMRLYLSLNYDRDHVLDVIHARQSIEPTIASMAARNRSDEELKAMRANLEELKEHEGDFVDLAGIDMRFHMLLARASGNPIIPLVLDPIHHLMPQIKQSVYASVQNAKDSAVEYHGRILAAIERGDEAGARREMEEHLKRAEDHARKMLAGRLKDKEEKRAAARGAADARAEARKGRR